jgi:hypothetical protein
VAVEGALGPIHAEAVGKPMLSSEEFE